MFIEIDIEKIKSRILKGNSIESVLSKFDWRAFESAVAEIFVANGFFVFRNVRFKTRRKYEIDLVALKSGKVFCVDCKEWRNGRYKKSALRKSAEKQILRTKELKKFVSKNPITSHKLKIRKNFRFYPAIVTLFEEGAVEEEILIIPVWKLNSFLNYSF